MDTPGVGQQNGNGGQQDGYDDHHGGPGPVPVADLSGDAETSAQRPRRSPGAEQAVREPWRMAAAYLDEVADSLGQGGRDVHTRTLFAADVATGVLKEAEAGGTDLIAIATHGRGGVTRAILGSVADKVIRGSNRPVLVYRPSEV
jgi:nucleotide-binding universal stress UspA family protein